MSFTTTLGTVEVEIEEVDVEMEEVVALVVVLVVAAFVVELLMLVAAGAARATPASRGTKRDERSILVKVGV